MEAKVTNESLGQLLEKLYSLRSENRSIDISEVPEVLREDLRRFMIGKTTTNGQIYNSDYRGWIKKLFYRGCDYPIKHDLPDNNEEA